MENSIEGLERRNQQAAAQSQMRGVLLFVSVGSFTLGVLDLLVGIVALETGSSVAMSFSYVWAGLLLAVVNGALALRGARSEPQLCTYWANLNMGFGGAALAMHAVDFALAATAVGMYGAPRKAYFDPAIGHREYVEVFRSVTPATPEAVRMVVLFALLYLECCQIMITKKYRASAATRNVAIFTTGQSNAYVAGLYLHSSPQLNQNQETPGSSTTTFDSPPAYAEAVLTNPVVFIKDTPPPYSEDYGNS